MMQRMENKKTAHSHGPNDYPINIDAMNASVAGLYDWLKEPLGKLPNGIVFNGPNYFINV